MSKPRQVVIFLFDDIEDLDFVGPLEVFACYGRPHKEGFFEIATVSRNKGPIRTRNGLNIQPGYSFGNCPQADILVVPGGQGSRREIENPESVAWVKRQAERAELVLSVCTGALLLAKAGLLEGLGATTHFNAMDMLAGLAPTADVRPGERFIDNGRIIVSAGVSAGIDAAFHILARLFGPEQAGQAAMYIEYEYYRPAV
ncbi:MAG: DJ-1/PfpI family protein [Desulfarculaceae bacterium]|jgi:transcriptional regulator GlxA family with amidase domain